MVVASGIGAITALLWSFIKSGDEIIADKTLYGCTFAFMEHGLSRFDIKVRFVDLTEPDALADEMTPNTVCFLRDTHSIRTCASSTSARSVRYHAQNARVIVDKYYGTPYLQRLREFGADFVIHSMTKYLSGHGDAIAGAIISPADDMATVRSVGLKDMTGAVLSAFDSFLLRGIKTLELRMERHCESALTIAREIESHPQVKTVYYPGLPSHPQYALACQQMKAFGGMIAWELRGGYEAGVRFWMHYRWHNGRSSLGDAETLVRHPASMTHNNYTEEERQAHGISLGLARISVGLENIGGSLSADILKALEQSSA